VGRVGTRTLHEREPPAYLDLGETHATICMRGDGRMNPQRNLGWLCAFVFGSAAFFLSPNFAHAQTQPSTQSLEGLWLADGYGMLIEFDGDDLRSYEITTLSCMSSAKATRKTEIGSADEAVFAGDGATIRVFPGASQDTRWLHENGAFSNILLRRTSSRPEPCGQPLADTPLTNYQVFWETFTEQYPFFALRQVDWLEVDKKFRPQVTLGTNPEELFRILSDMIEPMHDAHTFINAKSIQKRFRGFRPAADPMQEGNAALRRLLKRHTYRADCGISAMENYSLAFCVRG
jgi:hypothetical protein